MIAPMVAGFPKEESEGDSNGGKMESLNDKNLNTKMTKFQLIFCVVVSTVFSVIVGTITKNHFFGSAAGTVMVVTLISIFTIKNLLCGILAELKKLNDKIPKGPRSISTNRQSES